MAYIYSYIAIFFTISIFFKKYNFIYYLISLPGTIIHETMHYLVALLTNGRPKSFSLIPYKDGDMYTMGEVVVGNIRFYNAIPIAFAPLISLLIAYLMLTHFSEVKNIGPIDIKTILVSYVIFNLINGSIPSRQDVRVTIQTPSSYVFLIICIYAYYYFFQGDFMSVFEKLDYNMIKRIFEGV